MKKEILSFKELKIDRLPQFDIYNRSVKDLKAQLNIIYGPNAAGKTTLAKAFQYILWPDKAPDDASLRGSFTLGDDIWQAELNLGSCSYQKDGIANELNFIPAAEHSDRYYLALHDLLQEKTKNQSLAEIILKESAGGYQVSKAVKEFGFKEQPARKNKQTRAANEKIEKYRETKKEQQDLEQEEGRLAQLNEELNESKAAQRKLKIIEQALLFAEAKEKLMEAEKKYEQFPEKMSELKGDEIEEVEEFKRQISQEGTQIKEAEKEIENATKIIEESPLSKAGLAEGSLVTLNEKYDQLKSKEEEIEKLEVEVKEAEKRRGEAEKAFTSAINSEELTTLDKVGYDELNNFARKAQRVNNELEALNFLKNLLNPEEEFADSKRNIEEGIRYLEEWLQSPQIDNNIYNFSLVSGGIVSILGILLGIFITLFSFIFLFFGVMIMGYSLINSPNLSKAESRANIQARFALLDFDTPPKWREKELRGYLNQLYQKKAELELIERRKQSWQEKAEEYQRLCKEKEELDKEREELINHFGVAPDTNEQSLYYLTYHLNRWQDAYADIEAISEKIRVNRDNYQQLLEEINEELANYSYSVSDAAELKGELANLKSKNDKLREAIQDKERAKKDKERARKRLRSIKEQKKELFIGLDLEVDAELELKALCDCYEDYQLAAQELHRSRAICEQEKGKLKQYNDFEKSLLELDRLELEARKEELNKKAEQYNQIQKDINEIELKIKEAKKASSLEEAWHEKEKALLSLEKDLDSDYKKLLGYILAEHIKKQDSPANRSQVFREAQRIFTNITRGSYELRIKQTDSPSFYAFDTVANKGKKLNELSSGTRVQLLMAVRMAFVTNEEQGVTLPLYLDETLANADDRRAEEIIKAVITLARSGRQCFYFTAQKDEVRKWNSLLAKEAEMEANLIELKQEEKSYFDLGKNDFKIDELEAQVEEIPSAQGLSHDEYGEKLSIPDFNFYQGAQKIHLWYLVADIGLLEYLLKLGIKNWGQLKALFKTKRSDFFSAEKEELLVEVKNRGYLLEEFIKLWQRGRGKLVDYAALKDSGAVSDNFIEGVFALAEEVKGQGEAIIKRLRQGAVDRFRRNKMDELEEYFKEEGYIITESPLALADIRARLIGLAVGESGQERAKKVDRLLELLNVD
ncbi:AAA family ATPase [Fuchsiella alkaliacetigena]|uniref:AAA family ATPase n=1 Tax=Fuchsiella alkaliacetigena TaxID=957042 RepID=UPI00200A31AC|nr:AAA family ATPase [Fuchsiella alkaliacetigena]MCK8825251.1 AAA family ATPase [Fuchsiella alkaliacetigena]